MSNGCARDCHDFAGTGCVYRVQERAQMKRFVAYAVLFVLSWVFVCLAGRYCTADPTAICDATTELILGNR